MKKFNKSNNPKKFNLQKRERKERIKAKFNNLEQNKNRISNKKLLKQKLKTRVSNIEIKPQFLVIGLVAIITVISLIYFIFLKYSPVMNFKYEGYGISGKQITDNLLGASGDKENRDSQKSNLSDDDGKNASLAKIEEQGTIFKKLYFIFLKYSPVMNFKYEGYGISGKQITDNLLGASGDKENRDSQKSNLSDDDGKNASLAKIEEQGTIFKKLNSYFIGSKEKTEIDLNYPIYINDKNTIYNLNQDIT